MEQAQQQNLAGKASHHSRFSAHHAPMHLQYARSPLPRNNEMTTVAHFYAAKKASSSSSRCAYRIHVTSTVVSVTKYILYVYLACHGLGKYYETCCLPSCLVYYVPAFLDSDLRVCNIFDETTSTYRAFTWDRDWPCRTLYHGE